MFLTDHEWTLADNVLKDKKAVTHEDPSTHAHPMTVRDMLKEDGLKIIDALRAALLSASFYKHKNLYHCFCSGIESGMMRGLTESPNTKRLEDLLSVGTETHLRAELRCTLSEYGWFHNIGKNHRVARLKTFEVRGQVVREGRSKCGDKAWERRQEDMDSESDEDEDGEDEEEDDEPGDNGVDIGDAAKW